MCRNKRLLAILLPLALLVSSPAFATAYTSAATGNWSANATWTPNSGHPGAGDTAIIASGHTVTVDVNSVVGTSPPPTPTVIPSVSLTTGASVTSLPTGTYQFRYAYKDAGGTIGQVSVAVSTGAMTNGSSKPRWTMGAPPAGMTTVAYLTDTAGAAGTEHVYATGISGTTTDLISASYTDGTTTYAGAAAWVTQTALKINAGGTLTGSGSSSLSVRGDLIIGNTSGVGTLTGWADGILEFDPSSANAPTLTGYSLWFGDTNNFSTNYAKLLTSGTSAAHPFQIDTKSGSYKAARMTIGLFAFGQVSDSVYVNGSYVNVSRIGDVATDSIQFTGNTSVITMDHWIFDTCGRINWISPPPATSGWNLTNCTWKNGVYQANVGSGRLNPVIFSATAALTSGARTVSNCVFDHPPKLAAYNTTYSGDVFNEGWDVPGNTGVMWTSMDSCFVRWNMQGSANLQACGPVTNSEFLMDTAPTATTSGTATSAGSLTLVDSGKAWTVNAYQALSSPSATGNTPGNKGFFVLITGGAGAGQCRSINNNTATTLNLLRAWDTTPDVTSTYGVYEGAANPHMLGDDVPPNGSTVNITGNIFFYAGADNNGDCILHLDSGSGGSHTIYNVNNNIILPNLARDNSGTLVTVGADPNGEFHLLHNTYFTGAQSWSANEGVSTGMTGVVKEFKSNLSWCDPAQNYAAAGNNNTTASPLGPFMTVDSSHTPPTGAADIILNTAGVSGADYNAGYGVPTAYADQHFGTSGLGYQVNTTIAMGTHDIDGKNPLFVDQWRNPCTWGESLGLSGNKLTVLNTAVANLMALNDRSGYNSSYSVSALRTYLLAGMAPTNSLLKNAGSDGVTIGAVEGLFGFPASPGFGVGAGAGIIGAAQPTNPKHDFTRHAQIIGG